MHNVDGRNFSAPSRKGRFRDAQTTWISACLRAADFLLDSGTTLAARASVAMPSANTESLFSRTACNFASPPHGPFQISRESQSKTDFYQISYRETAGVTQDLETDPTLVRFTSPIKLSPRPDCIFRLLLLQPRSNIECPRW